MEVSDDAVEQGDYFDSSRKADPEPTSNYSPPGEEEQRPHNIPATDCVDDSRKRKIAVKSGDEDDDGFVALDIARLVAAATTVEHVFPAAAAATASPGTPVSKFNILLLLYKSRINGNLMGFDDDDDALCFMEGRDEEEPLQEIVIRRRTTPGRRRSRPSPRRRWDQREGRATALPTRGPRRGGGLGGRRRKVQTTFRRPPPVAVARSQKSPLRLRFLVLHGNADPALPGTLHGPADVHRRRCRLLIKVQKKTLVSECGALENSTGHRPSSLLLQKGGGGEERRFLYLYVPLLVEGER